MSARKSFPKPSYISKGSNYNSKEKSGCCEGTIANRPINVNITSPAKNACDQRTNRIVSIKSSRPTDLVKDVEILPTIVTIKQEDTSMGEPTEPQSITKLSFPLLKPFEIKLEKASISEWNSKLSSKIKRPNNTSSSQASRSASLLHTNTKSNVTRCPKILSATRFTPTSPKADIPGIITAAKSSNVSQVTFSAETEKSRKTAFLNSSSSSTNNIHETSPSPLALSTNIQLPVIPSSSFNSLDNITCNGIEPPNTNPSNIITPFSPIKLTPNDLRHKICLKKPTDNQSSETEDDLLDGISDDNLDSMSIHADDDDFLNDGESIGEELNSLGKHFSALSDAEKSGKKTSQTSGQVAKSKRKLPEELPAQGKMRRLENSNNRKTLPEEQSMQGKMNYVEKSSHHKGTKIDNCHKRTGSLPGAEKGDKETDNSCALKTKSSQSRELTNGSSLPNEDRNSYQLPGPHQTFRKRSHSSEPKNNYLNSKNRPNHYPPKHSDFHFSRSAGFPNMIHPPQNRFPGLRPFLPLHPQPQLPFHHQPPTGYQPQPHWEDFYRQNASFNKQHSFENRGHQETPRRSSVTCGNLIGNVRAQMAPTEKDLAKKQQLEHLYQKLETCITKQDFNNYIPICEEINKVSEGYLPMMFQHHCFKALQTLADEGTKKANVKLIAYVFNQIRKIRENTGLKSDDYIFAIESFLKSEEIDEAINLFLEMKSKGFKPNVTLRKLIKSGFLEYSVKDINCFIKFCDELGDNLITEKLVQETLKLISPEELKAKTKSTKIHSILQEIKTDTLPSQLHSTQQPNRLMQEIKDPVALVELINSIGTSKDARSVLILVQKTSKEILVNAGGIIWNKFLTLASIGPYADVQVASQIEGIMKENHIGIINQAALSLVCCLLTAGLSRPAVVSLNQVIMEELNEEDLTDEIHDCLCNTLQKPESCDIDNTDVAEKIIMIFIKCKRKPPENKLLHLLSCFKDAECFEKIKDIIDEMHSADMRASYDVYRLAFSALEFWLDNIDAVIELYAIMKRLYPKHRLLAENHQSSTDHSSNCSSNPETLDNNIGADADGDDEDDGETSVGLPEFNNKIDGGSTEDKSVCKFFLAGQICPDGVRCSCLHMLPAPPLVSPFQAKCFEEGAKPDSGYASSNHSFPPPRPPSVEPLPANVEYSKYYNRMLFAANSKDYHSLYKVYTDMRKRSIKIDDKILRTIYQSMLCDTPSEQFRELAELVKSELEGVVAITDDGDEDSSNQATLFDDEDQENLGRLGVRLIIFCNGEGYTMESHRILHIFHTYQINYAMFGLSFDRTIPHMSYCEVIVMIVDVCLKQIPPQIDDAIVVLTGASYGLPVDSDKKLTPDETISRNRVVGELIDLLLNDEKYEQAFQVVRDCFDEDNPGSSYTDSLNLLLLKLSESNQIESARQVFQCMQNRHAISREALRAYLNCLTGAERVIAARNVFNTGRSLGIYPTANVNNPHRLDVSCDLSRTEMLFLLEQHLISTRNDVLEPKDALLPLPSALLIRFTESHDSSHEIWSNVSDAKENMIIVLNKMMNPPLYTVDDGIEDSEILVTHASILNWYNCISDITKHRINLDVSVESKDTRRAVYKEPNEPSKKCIEVTTTTNITYTVSTRVKRYLSLGCVEPGQPFQKCCLKLTKLYKQYSKTEGLTGDDLRADINQFVDNFFEKHNKFV